MRLVKKMSKFVVPNTFTQNLDFNHKLEEFKTQDCMKNLIDYENSLTSIYTDDHK